MYTTPIGTIAIRMIGVVYAIRIKVVKIGVMANRVWRMNIGMFMSMISTSLENRLRILPSGVVSKKDIGACRTLSSSVSKRT